MVEITVKFHLLVSPDCFQAASELVDPEGPIFKVAHLGIVADYTTNLPTLIETCRELTQG